MNKSFPNETGRYWVRYRGEKYFNAADFLLRKTVRVFDPLDRTDKDFSDLEDIGKRLKAKEMKRKKRKETLLERYRRADDVKRGIEIAEKTTLRLLIENTARKVFLVGVLVGELLIYVLYWVSND